MKKIVVYGMIVAALVAMTACENSEDTEKTAKSGIGITTRVSESKGAAEEDGLVQTDVTVAAVTVDENGVILTCDIDEVQAKVNFDDDGTITSDLNTQISSKMELGNDYGMKAASSIRREWTEQANAFAGYCVGKTAEEIRKIAINEEGKPIDTEIASSCTVYAGNFVDTVVKAVENAK